MGKLIIIVTILLSLVINIRCQEATDSIILDPDYEYKKSNSFASVFYGQPGDAAAWSLLLPGAGQLYNKRWWKAPLVWAGEGYLIYNLANKNANLADWDNCWKNLLGESNIACGGAAINGETATEAFNERQDAKAARELAWIFFVAGHLIQTIEAFVDRHLINFDTSTELSLINDRSYNYLRPYKYQVSSIPIFSVNINLNSW